MFINAWNKCSTDIENENICLSLETTYMQILNNCV